MQFRLGTLFALIAVVGMGVWCQLGPTQICGGSISEHGVGMYATYGWPWTVYYRYYSVGLAEYRSRPVSLAPPPQTDWDGPVVAAIAKNVAFWLSVMLGVGMGSQNLLDRKLWRAFCRALQLKQRRKTL